jgi:2-dehydro-3-deoxyphosphogluconate aldolase/(4S)-4-hydroxy-2-oxoglutarate aldolase
MAKDRLAALSAIIAQGVVPVFNHSDADVSARVVEACAKGGAGCVELTNRGDFAAAVFADLARRFAGNPDVTLGVGSVVDAATTALYIANGARFVVSPGLVPDIARLCNRRKIPYMPGCATTTEIGNAEELGVEIVKMFPGGSVGGPEFVKAVRGPMPWTKIMPTGGVEPTRESLKAWFDAGVVAVGIGSRLISPAMLAAKDYAGIEKNVRDATGLVRSLRAA